MDKSKDPLTQLTSRWQTASFLGEALLEDYAERMEALTNTPAAEIIDAVNERRKQKAAEYIVNNLQMLLPTTISSAQEVWSITSVDVCDKLSIPVDRNEFRIDDVINSIKEKNVIAHDAMTAYFDAFEAYSLKYHSLRRKEPGTLEEFKALEKLMNEAKDTLDNLLNSQQ
jgi:hypothetical protein